MLSFKPVQAHPPTYGCIKLPRSLRNLCQGRKRQKKHKRFGPNFPADVPDPYARIPRGFKRFLPIAGAAGRHGYWCGTSLTRRALGNLCPEKDCVNFHPETNYHSWFLAPRRKLQKNGVSCRKMHFPAEKDIFIQKNALSCRKMPFPAETCTFLQKNAVFGWAQGKKLQEIAGGFLGSRVKNATRLSQETFWSLLRVDLPWNCQRLLSGRFSGNAKGCRKSIGHKVPWKIAMLLYLPATSRPLRKNQSYLLLTSRPSVWQLAFWILISLGFN